MFPSLSDDGARHRCCSVIIREALVEAGGKVGGTVGVVRVGRGRGGGSDGDAGED